MKKSKLLLALVLGIFIVFSSCKKKTLTDTENVEQIPAIIEKNPAENNYTKII